MPERWAKKALQCHLVPLHVGKTCYCALLQEAGPRPHFLYTGIDLGQVLRKHALERLRDWVTGSGCCQVEAVTVARMGVGNLAVLAVLAASVEAEWSERRGGREGRAPGPALERTHTLFSHHNNTASGLHWRSMQSGSLSTLKDSRVPPRQFC